MCIIMKKLKLKLSNQITWSVKYSFILKIFFFLNFYFIFKLYNIVLVLPNIFECL